MISEVQLSEPAGYWWRRTVVWSSEPHYLTRLFGPRWSILLFII